MSSILNSSRYIISFLSLFLVGCAEFTTIRSQFLSANPTDSDIPQPSPTVNSTLQLIQAPTPTQPQVSPQEVPVFTIPLAGPISSDKAEISGMAWYEDRLILLPQYPQKFITSAGSHSLFVLSKESILAYITGSTNQPLTPRQVPINTQAISGQIPGYEGFEAIAFDGQIVYLTIEANYRGSMMGYIIKGSVESDLKEIQLDTSSLTSIPNQVQIFNTSNESLLIAGDQILTLFEANGAELNSNPIANIFDKSLLNNNSVEFPNIEYRITDASAIDESGRFWVVNIFFPAELWFYTSSDPIAEEFGEGETHTAYFTVERLVELLYNEEKITFTGTLPIQLELIDDFNSRNWEALARLDDQGFLVMTDTYPETILGFIPYP
jgi:hypothetical protein